MNFWSILFFTFLLTSGNVDDPSFTESNSTSLLMMCSGNGTVIADVGVPDADNASGLPDGNYASLFQTGDAITLDLGAPVTAPTVVTVTYEKISTSGTAPTFDIFSSASAGSGFAEVVESPITVTSGPGVVSTFTFTIPVGDQYVEIESTNGIDVGIDAIEFGSLPLVTAAALPPTCVDGIPQSDGYLNIFEALNGTSYHWSLGNTFDDNGGTNTFSNATSLTGASYPLQIVTGITNPTGMQDYTIRVYSTAECFTDVVVTMNEQDCMIGCNCYEYIYVNDTELDVVHKFMVDNTTGVLTEVGNPWSANINDPHGAAMDLNGFLYVGEKNLGGAETSRLIKFGCDGERIDTLFAGNFNDDDVTNFVSDGNILYSAGRADDDVDAYDLCSETHLGTIDYSPGGYNWELFEGSDGLMYTIDRDENELRIFSVPYDVSQYGSGVTLSPILVTDLLKNGNDQYWGMDRDEFGYWYINVRHFDGGGDVSGTTIYMLSPTGQVLASITDDNDGGINDPGFFNTRGIAFSDTHDRLYLSSAYEACVAVVEIDRTSGSESLTLAPTFSIPGGGGKDISVVIECCPFNNTQTIDTILCAANVGDVLFLQELLDCDGIICEGLWQEGVNNNGLTYSSCENSITIDALSACGTYVLESDGSANLSQCGAFNAIVNIIVVDVTPAEVAGDQTVCMGTDPDAFTVTTSSTAVGNLSYQWQSSTTDCTSDFSDIAGATSATYDPPMSSTSATTFYRVISSADNVTCPAGICADTSNCVTVAVLPSPSCNITIDLTAPVASQDLPASGPAGMTAYQWSITTGDAIIDGANNTQAILVDLGTMPSTLQLVVTDANGCLETCTVILPTGCLDPNCYGIQITRN